MGEIMNGYDPEDEGCASGCAIAIVLMWIAGIVVAMLIFSNFVAILGR